MANPTARSACRSTHAATDMREVGEIVDGHARGVETRPAPARSPSPSSPADRRLAKAIKLRLRGDDVDELRAAAQALKQAVMQDRPAPATSPTTICRDVRRLVLQLDRRRPEKRRARSRHGGTAGASAHRRRNRHRDARPRRQDRSAGARRDSESKRGPSKRRQPGWPHRHPATAGRPGGAARRRHHHAGCAGACRDPDRLRRHQALQPQARDHDRVRPRQGAHRHGGGERADRCAVGRNGSALSEYPYRFHRRARRHQREPGRDEDAVPARASA